MSNPHPPRPRGVVRVLACALVLLPATAAAQQLRGQVTEDEIARELLVRRQQGNLTETYSPFSSGAVPDEQQDEERARELFPSPTADEQLFSAAPTPAARRSLARQREAQAAPPEQEGPEAGRVGEPDEESHSVRASRLDLVDEEANRRLERDNDRTAAIERRDADPEDNPYAPLGLRLGTFNANATFDQGLTWTSNADSSPAGGEAILSETQLRFNAYSDWSRHAASVSAYGIVRRTVSGAEISEAEGGVDAAIDLDLSGGWAARAGIGYALRPESATSPIVIEDTVSRPLRHTLRADVGVSKAFGKFRLGVTGDIDRQDYADAKLSGGGTLSQEERNSTLATVKLRAGYEISPALVPFVETEIGRRFYDVRTDSSGYARSADRLAFRGGTEIALGEKLNGEVSAGWLRESFDDDRLTPLEGLSLEAALRWSPERDTMIAFSGTTEVEGTTTAGDSGSIRYGADVSVERRVRANLTAGAALGAAWRDYAGSSDHELTLKAETSATWWFNRYAGLTARWRHETFRSTLPDRDSRTDSVYLGVKLQR